jgi:ATP-binding cassette, subfamily B (MDR/TAP), member 1
MIAPAMADIAKATAAAKDILDMLRRKSAIDSASTDGLRKDSVAGDMELRGVTFAYPARPTIQVLNDVHLKFPSKKITALVGASGCGKSTIVGLLERWYDPSQGQVFLDGEDIKNLNVQWLRNQIGLVQQVRETFSS